MAHLRLRGEPLRGPSGLPIPIDAVLFDKDGTLSHSEPMLLRLSRLRLEHCLSLSHGGAELRDLLVRAYGLDRDGVHPGGITAVGARDHNLIATATALAQVGHSWPDGFAIAEEAFETAERLLAADPETPTPQPLPGTVAMLNRLSGAGLICAVISNDHRHGIQQFLATHALAHHFTGLWSAEHHPRKPAPAAVQGLCDQLGVAPGRCALIGDAASDLRMATAAGVPIALGYRAGWRRPPQLDPGSLGLEHWDELDARPG